MAYTEENNYQLEVVGDYRVIQIKNTIVTKKDGVSVGTRIERDSVKSKGINIWHIPNPETNNNDITMIQFDMRMFQKELLEASQPTPAFTAMLNQTPQVNPPNSSPSIVGSNQQTQTVTPTPQGEEVVQ